MGKLFIPAALLVMACLAVAPLQAKTSQKSAYVSKQEQADQQYANGNYTEALPSYLRLAKQGDAFSQYRVSYMYLQGQGRETDIVESFVWATLAAQNRADPLIDYRDTVARLVPADKQKKAMRKLDYYMRKWGNRKLASDMITKTQRELQGCTGSRLGSRCEEIYMAEMPRFWGINPGNGVENAGGGRAQSGSQSSDIGVGTGGPQRDVAYYQGLRKRIDELNRYIGENSGNVQLGDFEVIEDEKAAESQNEGESGDVSDDENQR